MPCPVEVHAVSLLEIGLRLAGQNGCEMEDHVGPAGYEIGGHPVLRQVGQAHRYVEVRMEVEVRLHDIDERELRDRLAAEAALACEERGQLSSEHACAADDQDAHATHTSGSGGS